MAIPLTTSRLALVPADHDLLTAHLAGPDALAGQLGVSITGDWPPEYLDDEAVRWTLAAIERDLATADGWSMWYVVARAADPAQLIGACGFKGPPDEGGTVEIGYGIIESWRRRGIASEATERLIEWAFARGAMCVVAETYVELVGSLGVMRRCGFVFAGPGSENRVVRYELTRAAWDERRVATESRRDG